MNLTLVTKGWLAKLSFTAVSVTAAVAVVDREPSVLQLWHHLLPLGKAVHMQSSAADMKSHNLYLVGLLK